MPVAHGHGVSHSAVTAQVCKAEVPGIAPQIGGGEVPEQIVPPGTHSPMGAGGQTPASPESLPALASGPESPSLVDPEPLPLPSGGESLRLPSG